MRHTIWMRGCGMAIVAGLLAGPAGAQAIYSACELGQVDQVKTFLDKDPALANSKDNNGFAPLHWAAGGGSRDVTAILLGKGADVNARNDSGATPLHLAAFMGRNDVVELLLAKGADVNARNLKKRTPLHNAAGKGYKPVVKTLLAKGAEVNAQDDLGLTPLHTAALYGRREVVERADVTAPAGREWARMAALIGCEHRAEIPFLI